MPTWSRLLLSALIGLTLTVGSYSYADDPAPPMNHPAPGNDPSSLLDKAQQLFYKNDHDGALGFLQKYFSSLLTLPKEKARAKLRFFAIATMGRIYLQYKRDPANAIRWFEKEQKTQHLTDAENDIISGWIEAAKDWQKLGKFPSETSSESELFNLGKRYYQAGLKKQKYALDQRGAADFSIAASFLVPFLVHYDKSANVGEALFMMGDIRRRLWESNHFWSENYYLTETIRRFPGTPLAVKAYDALEEDVHFGYSGSGGDSTPPSWVELLKVFKKLAHEKPTESEKAKSRMQP